MKRKYVHTKPPAPLPNIKDGSGWTPLHWGAYKGNRELCTILIRHKAMLMEPDTCGNTPLHLACFNGASEAAVFLAEQLGRDGIEGGTNKGNKFGSTPIMEAASNGHADLAASLVKLKIDWLPSSETGPSGGEKTTSPRTRGSGSPRTRGSGTGRQGLNSSFEGSRSRLDTSLVSTEQGKPSKEVTAKK
jgi:ankyrin repeat protein